MKNYIRKKLHLISKTVGHLHEFLLRKKNKGKYESRKILGFARKNKKN
jgi:hypothetical protein